MGNAVARMPCELSREEVEGFASTTLFNGREVRALWYHFKAVSSKSETITRAQFQTAVLFKDTALLDRIFRVFDQDDDNSITFSEFISCLSTMSSKATQEEKLKLAFAIYDFDGDDRISVDDLTSALASTLREHNIVISRADIDVIVAGTMREAASSPANEGHISFAEFKALVSKRPQMLDCLNINISKIIDDYSRLDGVSFVTPRLGYSGLQVQREE